ncbi:hypothetical protein MGYG_04096 [Nannizzia gypsea CBS 118893]|uniref:Uncharacterized protein n=1 Tax=Arthroderma gypseum (strain ATCC MYA-4604 / CBS 118893) TaxID=535722 RepID=E4UUX5_ARTGP|nr:hypothetical protein MGYG_04096 [Nannizzia gypsea CBS 118893]EFR01092.1 hypothetical protein MGYG_04096 [Nannizzia gypsea CBS 118893]
MFSFPAQLESDQQTRNWYQDLLDHAECQDNPVKVQQAYESYRQASLSRSLASLTQPDGKPKITPSSALVQYLSHAATTSIPGEIEKHYSDESINCMVIWARPSQKILDLLLGLQNRLKDIAGADMWFPKSSRLHLSVVEISHRHPMAHLRSVFNQIGRPLVQGMLDLPATHAASQSKVARLGRPMLLFDAVGVAIAFVPVGTDPYTYHHLRRDLHNLAISSGVKTDTCYTACMGHITLGRFVSTKHFDSEDEGTAQQRLQVWADTIQGINEELSQRYQAEDWEWAVGEEKGLELQMGMLKFGRDTEAAEIVGRNFGTEATTSMTPN